MPLLRAVLRAGEDEERIGAARALGELAAADAREDLRTALADGVWEVRAQAATALGRLGDPASVPTLEAAMGDRAWWVRANAATALARLGPEGRAALSRVGRGADPYAEEALQGIAV